MIKSKEEIAAIIYEFEEELGRVERPNHLTDLLMNALLLNPYPEFHLEERIVIRSIYVHLLMVEMEIRDLRERKELLQYSFRPVLNDPEKHRDQTFILRRIEEYLAAGYPKVSEWRFNFVYSIVVVWDKVGLENAIKDGYEFNYD
jgi:hypothetical protein